MKLSKNISSMMLNEILENKEDMGVPLMTHDLGLSWIWVKM